MWSCPILGRPAGRVAGLTGEPRRLLSVPAVATSQALQAVSTQPTRLLPESQPLKPELQHPVPTGGRASHAAERRVVLPAFCYCFAALSF